MAAIILRCPKTRVEILPAIEIAKADFRTMQSAGTPAKCPVCGEEHVWLPYAAGIVTALGLEKSK